MYATSASHTPSHSRSQQRAASASSLRVARTSGRNGVRVFALDVCSSSLTSPEVTAAHKFDPSLPAGDASFDPTAAKYYSRYDNSKSQQVLGLRYHTIEECTVDTLKQFKEKGWY